MEKKKDRRKKTNKIENFAVDFLDCKEKKLNSGAIFVNGVKGNKCN